MDVLSLMNSAQCNSPTLPLTHINTPRLILRMLAGLIWKEPLMKQSLLTVSSALLFIVLTTFSVQANVNDVSNTNEVSVNTEVEPPLFRGSFESTAIASFTASPDSIPEGESTTISWSTINAVSCAPSGDNVEWNNSTLGVPSGQVQITIPAVGNYSLTLTCDGETEGQDVKTISVSVTELVVVPILVIGFVATPDSIIEGENTTISWNIQNATSCTPSGNLEEWNNSGIEVTIEEPSGELQITISTAGNYLLSLICESETADPVTVYTPVTVTESVADCARTLPLGDETLWFDVFDVAWPGPKSRQAVRNLPRRSYVSLEFHTGQVEDTGVVSNFEATATSGSRLFAISKCPGDFNVAPECRNVSDAYQEDIFWATTDAPGPAYCQLEKDTTYYWNTTFTDGVDSDTSECDGTFCLTTLRVWNSDYVE